MKKILLTTKLLLTFFISIAQIPNGAVANYKFSNNLADDIGLPANLNPSNQNFSFTTDRDGNLASALDCNGSPMPGYIFQANAGNIINNFSIAFWMKIDGAINSGQRVLQAFELSGSVSPGFLFEIGANSAVGIIYNVQGGNHNAVASIPSLFDGAWHHVAITFYGSGGVYDPKFYVDGVDQTAFSQALNSLGGTMWDSQAEFVISPTGQFQDNIDDIYIYERELTAQEVTQLFNASGTASGVQSKFYVDIQNGNDNNDGSSWVNAVRTIGQAQSLVADNGEIWVAGGTYTPDATDRNASFTFNRGIKYYGGFDGTEVTLADRVLGPTPTILSGDLSGNDTTTIIDDTNSTYSENSVTVTTFSGSALIDGFTISGGFASGGNGTPVKESNGAAVFIENSNGVQDVTIKNCIIENNVARLRGAAIYNFRDFNTNLILENSIIRNNYSLAGTGLWAILRGGAGVTHNIYIQSCLFDGNEAGDTAANDNSGFGSSTIIVNDSRNSGSTVVRVNYVNNTFVNNRETGTGYSQFSGSFATNIVQNLQGIYSIVFSNNLAFGNTRSGFGTVQSPIADYQSSAAPAFTVRNNLHTGVWGNVNSGSIQGTISSAPTFVDATNGDFRLASGSAGIDQGLNSAVVVPFLTDLDGEQRIENGTVDIGAYEFRTTASIDDVAITQVRLFPNPVQDILTVDCGDGAFAKANLYNLQGQQLDTFYTKQIDLSDISRGIYLLQVELENGAVTTQKIIKE